MRQILVDIALVAGGLVTGYQIAIYRLSRRRVIMDGMLEKLHREFSKEP